MQCPDVNILVNAFREEIPRNSDFKEWLEQLVYVDQAFGMSDLVLSGFLRVVTSPKIFRPPNSLNDALAFAEALRNRPNCRLIEPGSRHWDIFTRRCQSVGARGPIITDVYFAALAIEHGLEWITMDGDYARFPGLRWRRPFDPVRGRNR